MFRSPAAWAWGLVAVGGLWLAVWLAPIPGTDILSHKDSVVFEARDKTPLREVADDHGLSSSWVSLKALPPSYLRLLLLSEDQRFYRHLGLDPIALVRALTQNIRANQTVSGASTLTQQLAKLMLNQTLTRSKWNKIKECLLALAIEIKYSKNDILEAYVNKVTFGYQTRGIKSAAYFYFASPPEGLSLAQQAALIVIGKSPAGFDPFLRPGSLNEASRYLLTKALKTHLISQEEYHLAQNVPLVAHKHYGVFFAPHFINFLLSQPLPESAFHLTTSLDKALQEEVSEIISAELYALKGENISNAACIVVDVKTGEVLSYVGSQAYFSASTSGQVDGVQAKRQPGSLLKPLAYAYAFEKGYSPITFLEDKPRTYYSNGGYFTPKNYSETYLGNVTVRTALANSLNAPSLYLASQLSLSDLLNRFRAAGLQSLDKPSDYYGLGMVLGNGEVSLWELAQAYLTLANGGKKIPLAVTPVGPKRWTHFPQIFDPKAAYLITNILSDSTARLHSFGRYSPLNQVFDCAVKTGTSTNYRDNWCIGYTPDYLVGVWVGNFDNKPMYGVSGVSGAGPIWHSVMKAVVGDRRSLFLVPDGIAYKNICPKSGLLTTPLCPNSTREPLAKDAAQRLTNCPLKTHSPREIATWSSATHATRPGKTSHQKPVTITYPYDGSRFAIDPRINRDRQKIAPEYLSLLTSADQLTWTLDGKPLRHPEWRLTKGRHVLELTIRSQGQVSRDKVIFEVF